MNPSSIQGALSRFNSMSSDEWTYRDDLTGLAEMMIASDDGLGTIAFDGASNLDDLRVWLHDTASTERATTEGTDGHPEVAVYLDDVVAGVPATSKPGARVLAAELASRTRVLDGFAALPPNYRVALVLKDGANLTVGQIGDLMGTSEASVRSVLYRARRSLRGRSEG